MTVKLIEHDPNARDQIASLEALDRLAELIKKGLVKGYFIAMVATDGEGNDIASIREAVSGMASYDLLALNGALVQAQAYVSECLTAEDE